ncbi:MAG: InlB B-repeat-containing protein [Peptococcaceae bacterium]|nr:InlB B-repeat-containing protein [Peptococcaceae bacterium]
MKRKICALFMVFVFLFSLLPSPSAWASENGLKTLTIEYYIQGTETKIAPTYKASLPAGSSYDVESPAVVGYKVADDNQQTVSGMLDEDTNVQVYYTTENAKASYTINYIGRSIDGTVKETLSTFNGTDAVGEIITVEDKTFPGYVRDPGTLNLKITADGNAELNVYYTETVKPCIVFSTGGDYVAPIVEEAGTNISTETTNREEATPERPGYDFAGWDWNGDGVHDDKDQPLITMPENDLVINAIWTPGTSEYIVEYYFQDTEGDGYTRNDGMDEVRQATTGSTVTASEDDQKKGISIATGQGEDFYGFDYSHCVDTTVTADGQAILKLYYDREIWSIKLHKTPMRSSTTWGEYRDEILPNQDNTDDIWLSFEGRYGSSFPDNFPTVEQLIEYYDPLCPEEWEDYFYVNILWAAQSSWANNEGKIEDDHGISSIHNYENRKFDMEDEPGSREINVYPYYAEGVNVFHIDYYLQDLDDPEDYTLVRARTLTLTYQDATFNVTDNIEGFTIVGGEYRSKKVDDEWPVGESGPSLYPVQSDDPNVVGYKNWPTGYWTEVEANYTGTGTVKLPTMILTDTELHFVRQQYDLSFYSDNTLIQSATKSDIYYEAPLADYLKYEPSEDLARGRTFLGWCLSTGDELPDGEIEMVDEDMTMPAADVYLHAVWSEPKHTVSFDSHGGTDVEDQKVEHGTPVAEPTPPTKDGCTFVGWYDEDGARWSFDQEITEDTELHAVWRQEGEASYTVKHIVVGENEPFATSNGTGKPGDTITDRALGMGDDEYRNYMQQLGGEIYMLPDASVKSLVLKEGKENVIIFYYSPSPTRDYTVHYYLEGTTTSVYPDKEVNDTDLTVVTEEAENVSGYELATDDLTNGKYQTVELVAGKNNEIIFYYKLNEDTAVIAPAPVTIYMGGDGYDGAIDEDGKGLQSTNGFPEPGFTISAPEGVDEDTFDPTKATLKYKNGDDEREWNIVPYDKDEDATHGIYRFEPTDPNSGTDVRMQFIKADGTVVTEDDFVISDYLDQDLTMEVYGDSIDAGYVTLEYNEQSYKVAAGTAILTIRSTTDQVQYGDVVENEDAVADEKPGVVAPDDTIYYINNDPVKVVNTSEVKLLFDDIIETSGSSNTELLEEKTNEVLNGLGQTSLSGGTRHYQCKYLDLVDTSNGNVWVAASNTVTVYWPLPDGTDGNTRFELLHYTDENLHREEAVDDIADIINGSSIAGGTIQRESIINTGTHIKFDVPRAGFSPFVLVWETNGGTTDPDTGTDPDQNYTLHYESNGGTEYLDETYKPDTEVTLDKVPVRDGYTFTGWYADENLTQKITEVTMDSDKTVYAGWQKDNSGTDPDPGTVPDPGVTPDSGTDPDEAYTLHYVSNGGTPYDDETYEPGTEVDLDKEPVKDGYTFTGWYSDPELTDKITEVTMDGDKVVYAGWEKDPDVPAPDPDKEYTLHYVSNGGTPYDDETYEPGTEVNLDKEPVKDGYTFTGWYSDPELTDKITEVTMDSDKVVYAGWEKNEPGNPPDGSDTPMLNTTDHYSYIVGYPEDYRTGAPTNDESLWPVKPQGNITRAEVATIFYRLLTDEARAENWTQDNGFTDVDKGDWFNTPVSTLSAMGIIGGYEDGSFQPNAPITRAEFAAIAVRFFEEKSVDYEMGSFIDIQGDEWYADAIQAAKEHGIIGGYEDGSFQPNDVITRAEACSIVNRTLKRIPEKEHLLPESLMRVWPDNADVDAWFYEDMQEATSSHEYEWIVYQDETVENWTGDREEIDWDEVERELCALHGVPYEE